MESNGPDGILRIVVSTRALFNLESEHEIAQQDLTKFHQHQATHVNDVIPRGAGYLLIKSLTNLNRLLGRKVVSLTLLSRNHPIALRRVEQTLRTYDLEVDFTIATGGDPIMPHLKSLNPALFLSADQLDVQGAIQDGYPAALVKGAPAFSDESPKAIVIAFDGDCVLFSEQSERIYLDKGPDEFFAHEQANALIPLPDGPLAPFYRKLSELKRDAVNVVQIKLALVTARSGPARFRALETLHQSNGELDFAACLGPAPKTPILENLRPAMFFDDDRKHCSAAEGLVPTAQVLYGPKNAQPIPTSNPNDSARIEKKSPSRADRPDFRVPIQEYVGSKKDARELSRLCQEATQGWPAAITQKLFKELEESVRLQPTGSDRPARGIKNTKAQKMGLFIEKLIIKHRPND